MSLCFSKIQLTKLLIKIFSLTLYKNGIYFDSY